LAFSLLKHIFATIKQIMKYINPARLSTFFKKISLLSFLFAAVNFAHGQCLPPVAIADYYTISNNYPASLNVTANDLNAAGGPLALTILHGPRHGTAIVSGSEVVYTTTQSGYVGPDTFVYTIQDTCPAGGNTSSAYVYLDILTFPAPRTGNSHINYSWSSPCSSVNVLSNDSIGPGNNMTITFFDATTVRGGIISRIGDSTLCYTPDSFFAGIDTFRYIVCNSNDTTQCATAYVIVTIPVLARMDNVATKEDFALAINVTANDAHTGNGYITLCSSPQHGTVSTDGSNMVLYTPAHDYPVDPFSSDTLTFTGIDSFCYTLCGQVGADTLCSSAEVYLAVLPAAKFYIPQGISPNGDGINDVFVIASADQFPLSQLLVYNRYGDEVWRNDNNGYQNEFDGTWKKNGQPLPDGSYWYIFKFNDGVTRDRMGYIVIQR
jgi:gliding motility-associated-like protein